MSAQTALSANQKLKDLSMATLLKTAKAKKLTLEKTVQVCRANEITTQKQDEVKGNATALNAMSAYKSRRQKCLPI